jgi:molecular chaperone GrpE
MPNSTGAEHMGAQHDPSPAEGTGDGAARLAEPAEAPSGDGGAQPAPEQVDSEADRDDALARLEDRWRRALADLDNLRKRFAREVDRERSQERSRVAATWLPVVDDLERALSYEGGNSGAVVEGVRTVLAHAVQVLERLGYARDTMTGVPFDPQRHEVVGVVEQPDTAPGTVVEVLRAGYGTGGQQLRPAAVVVSRRGE